MNKTYNMSKIMTRAWKLFREFKGKVAFGECLHRAWLIEKAKPVNAERIEKARIEAGVTEEVNTYKSWLDLGYKVISGSTNLFKAVLINGKKGDGATRVSVFFGRSQVEAIATA